MGGDGQEEPAHALGSALPLALLFAGIPSAVLLGRPSILGRVKPIGPYVAVQALPPPASGVAAADSMIQTLRATDRLTGIPVLLHVLPQAQSLPEIPVSPHLLPVVDSGVDGEQAYLVTELPLQAHPALDPLLAARGALAALDTLHGQGLAHGGVSQSQLWNHDGGVALAGAGLPWREDATPQADLSDLALTLQAMGALPEALAPLRDQPGTLSARAALARLADASPDGPQGVVAGSGGSLSPAAAAPLPEPGMRGADPTRTAEAVGLSRTPAVRVVARSQAQEAGEGKATASSTSGVAAPSGAGGPEQLAGKAEQKAAGQGEGTGQLGRDAPAPAPLVSPFSNAPTGQPETPQERRKRQNDERREQAMLDSQAAAQRKAARLKAQQEEEARHAASAAEQAALGVPVPEPFQMGFVPTQPAGEAHAGADVQSRQIERLPASLRRPSGPPQDAVQRLPGGESAPARASARNLTPIRIGWDEDDSWRVVRTAPETRPTPPLMRWVPLALALVVLLVLALVWALGARTPSAVGADPVSAGRSVSSRAVTFTVRGAAGVTAQLSVVSAPDGANLSAGQNLGAVPGQIQFPVEGPYRLKVVAQGYRPATLDLKVPRTQPVTIDLGN